MQTAVSSPDMTPGPAAGCAACTPESGDTIPTAANDRDYPAGEPPSTKPKPVHDAAANPKNAAILATRRTLIAAITKRITQRRLTAAQAACVLHLTGPRVTKRPEANINEFTLDELVNLLPVLELTVQVVPSPNVTCGPLAQVHGLTIDQGPSRRCSMNSVRERTRRHRQVRQSCIEPARNWRWIPRVWQRSSHARTIRHPLWRR
jgi:predicted XRE-type DNA-binding protein